MWPALAASDLLSSCDLHFHILPLFLVGEVVNSTMQCLVNQGHLIRHFVVVGWLSLYFGEICHLVPWALIRLRKYHLQLVGGLSLSPKGAKILLFSFLAFV